MGLGIHLPENVQTESEAVDLVLDYVQLRDSCRCSRCVDPHSKQRHFKTSNIPLLIRVRHARWDDGGQRLEVQWENDINGFDDSHLSIYDADFLRSTFSCARDRSAGHLIVDRLHWCRLRMEELQTWISYDDFVNDDAKFCHAMRRLAQLGLIFMKDIPDSRDMPEKIATRMGPLRNTFYGLTWDVRALPKARNVAYTDQALGFHVDLMYTNEPPGYQILQCLRNSCEGGESMFVDGVRAATQLRNRDQHAYDVLRRFQVGYEYAHDDHHYRNSWPVIETQVIDNKSIVQRVNYSPPFQAPFHSHSAEHPSSWSVEFRAFTRALNKFVTILEEPCNVFELKLNPGECAIFENRRVLHGRRAFDISSGERWLAGTYVDEDALRSTFRLLRQKNQAAWVAGAPV
ncbi:hypothetical protein Egran_06238 [Elaphomyces granulatus]|uniref:TauD/TfdA-like domain-containing protein n=1 Tax=Elaphomyces granulatus TaxID=519963 RepID=A0A232LPC2_9EURO|nr:hypothetical protein Egran_06238 [Elaphomyces granulatus]